MLKAVIGLQFGDEGKGKFVDFLSKNVAHIVRFNGGANAGHSVQHNDVRVAFSQIPASLNDKKLYVCQGALISPDILVKEIAMLQELGIKSEIYIDPRCHVVLSIHAELNKASESYKGKQKIGSVGIGIGACFEDKANRHGIRLIELTDKEKLREKLLFLWNIREKQIKYVFKGENQVDFEEELSKLYEYGKFLAPYFTFTNSVINKLLAKNEDVLLETSQATFLDNAFGSYPYTVAYQTLVQTCFPMIGIPAQDMRVTGVMKAYMIRVGNGPFPTELFDNTAEYIRVKGHEYGTVSKRPRRCGWLDLNLINHAIKLNGVNELAITNLDVLSDLSEIQVAVSYLHNQEAVCSNTALLYFDEVEPVYKTFKGWQTLKERYHSLKELPFELIEFLRYIEKSTKTVVKYLSYGPDREQTLVIGAGELQGLSND